MASSAESVMAVKDQLVSILDDNAPAAQAKLAGELVSKLEAVQMSSTILAKTKIGLTLGKLRKVSSSEYADVAVAAKKLVKRWKSELTGNLSPATPSTPSESSASIGKSNVEDKALEKVLVMGELAHPMRNKVQKLIHRHLGEKGGSAQLRINLAVDVEEALWTTTGSKGDKQYNNKLKSIIYNLKDPKNPELNQNLFTGKLTPKFLVTADSTDLASDSLKKNRNEEKQYSIDAARSDWDADAGATDIFQCSKCKKWKTSYTQAQTRSADEPMTLFIHCLNCGKRWKQ